MKKIYMSGINNQDFVMVDDDNYEIVQNRTWYKHQDRKRNTWYAVTYNPYARMHRLIMGVTVPTVHIDHINRCGWDNQKHNLRISTPSQNSQNRAGAKGAVSQYKGVCRRYGTALWFANIKVHDIRKRIGDFEEEIHAAYAYDVYAKFFLGEYSCPNFPDVVHTFADIKQWKYKNPKFTSQYLGVCWNKHHEKWNASTTQSSGKKKHIGYFANEIDAAMAYDKTIFNLFGENGPLNFPHLFLDTPNIHNVFDL